MGVSRRPTSARCASLLLYCHRMKLLSLSSWNSTTGSLELGKKDFHAKYIVKEQLGKGGFGVVYSAERRSDGMEVAVKEVSKDEKVMMGEDNIPLKVDTSKRLTLAEIAAHPWLCITSAPKANVQGLVPSNKRMLFSCKSVCHSSSCSSSSSLASIVIS